MEESRFPTSGQAKIMASVIENIILIFSIFIGAYTVIKINRT